MSGINPQGLIFAALQEQVTVFQGKSSGAGRQSHDFSPFMGDVVLGGEQWRALDVSALPESWRPEPMGTVATSGPNTGSPIKSNRADRLISKVTTFLNGGSTSSKGHLPEGRKAKDFGAYRLEGGVLSPMSKSDDTLPTVVLWHEVSTIQPTAATQAAPDGPESSALVVNTPEPGTDREAQGEATADPSADIQAA